MLPKPRHLGPDYAAQFQDAAVVAAYGARPPYPAELFDILAGLVVGLPVVLDLGCGTGDLARGLVGRVARVDAVDPSAAMLAAGRQLPGGGDDRLRWIAGTAEDAPLSPPYGLATAAESAHWIDWEVAFPRIRSALAPGAWLALVGREQPPPWDADALALIRRYSTNRDFQPYDIFDELAIRGLFRRVGEARTPPRPFRQDVDAYVESFHSRNGLSRDRMPPADARAFDDGLRALLRSAGCADEVELQVSASVVWGEPGAS